MSDSIDYRKLLKKYMHGVIEAESTSFIGLSGAEEEELHALHEIEDEVRCERHDARRLAGMTPFDD